MLLIDRTYVRPYKRGIFCHFRSDNQSQMKRATLPSVCPTVSGQRALRSHSWLTQPSGSLAVRCVKIRYADCYAVSSLSELGNLYRVHSVLLRIFGSTSLYTNINIAQLKINLNLSNSV